MSKITFDLARCLVTAIAVFSFLIEQTFGQCCAGSGQDICGVNKSASVDVNWSIAYSTDAEGGGYSIERSMSKYDAVNPTSPNFDDPAEFPWDIVEVTWVSNKSLHVETYRNQWGYSYGPCDKLTQGQDDVECTERPGFFKYFFGFESYLGGTLKVDPNTKVKVKVTRKGDDKVFWASIVWKTCGTERKGKTEIVGLGQEMVEKVAPAEPKDPGDIHGKGSVECADSNASYQSAAAAATGGTSGDGSPPASGGGLPGPAMTYSFGAESETSGLPIRLQNTSLNNSSFASGGVQVPKDLPAGAVQNPSSGRYTILANGCLLELADVAAPGKGMTARFFDNYNVDGSNRRYGVGNPLVSWVIEDPNPEGAAANQQIRVTETRSTGETTVTLFNQIGTGTAVRHWQMSVEEGSATGTLPTEATSLELSSTGDSLIRSNYLYSKETGALLSYVSREMTFGDVDESAPDLFIRVVTTRQYSSLNDMHPLVSVVKEHTDEEAVPVWLRGKPVETIGFDGKHETYSYEPGLIHRTIVDETRLITSFDPESAGDSLHTTIVEGWPNPIPLVSIRREVLSTQNVVNREETHVFGAPGGVNTLLERIEKGFGLNGEVRTLKNGRVIREEVYDYSVDNGRLSSVTDDGGNTTLYTGYVNGQAQYESRLEVPGVLPGMETFRQFDDQGRTILEQQSAAGCATQVHEWHYDTQGRVDWERINGDNAQVTTYNYSPDGLTVTTTQGSNTEIAVSNAAGRFLSLTRLGTIVEQASFAIDLATGFEAETRTMGPPGAPWRRTVRDAAGRVVREESPLPGGATLKRRFVYGNGGEIAEEWLGDGTNDVLLRSTNVATRVTTIYAGPDPNRTETYSLGYTYNPGGASAPAALAGASQGWYQRVGLDQGNTYRKVGGFTADEVSETISADAAGNVTRTREYGQTGIYGIFRLTEVAGNTASGSFTSHGITPWSYEVTPFKFVSTSSQYDGFRRVKSSVTLENTGERQTSLTYDPVYGQIETAETGSDLIAMAYYPPGHLHAGRLKSRTTNESTVYFNYDSQGNLSEQWGNTYPVKYAFENGLLTQMTTYRDERAWLGASRPASGFAQPGDTTTWEYYPQTTLLKRKIDAKGRDVLYDYDGYGRLWHQQTARERAAGGRIVTTYLYNTAGELREKQYNDATTGVTLNRDAQGRVSAITDDEGSHTFSYSASGGAQTVIETVGQKQMTRVFDAWGDVKSYSLQIGGQPVAQGSWIRYSYGELAFSDGTHTVTLGGVPGGYGKSYSVNGITQTKTYGPSGRVANIKTTVNGATKSNLSPHYDGRGLIDRVALTEGDYWEYGYDGRQQVTAGSRKLKTGELAPGMQFGYTYDAIGNRLSSSQDADVSSYSPNELNQYPSRGNPAAVHLFGAADGDSVVFDSNQTVANRVGSAFHLRLPTDNSASPVWQPFQLTVAKRGTLTGTADQFSTRNGRIAAPPATESLAYDEDGNLISDGQWEYTWDAENRLVKINTNAVAIAAGIPGVGLTFAYDSVGRRIEKRAYRAGSDGQIDWSTETSSIRFHYNGWNLIAETNQITASTLRTYLWGPDMSDTLTEAGGVGGLLLVSDSGLGKTAMPTYDPNGNIVSLIDLASKTLVGEYAYGPFGETIQATGTMGSANPIQFSTKYLDDETGLIYYGLRYYSPGTGRWTSRDPKEEDGGLNLMSFVENASTSNFDPLGLASCPCEYVEGMLVKFVPSLLPPGFGGGGQVDLYVRPRLNYTTCPGGPDNVEAVLTWSEKAFFDKTTAAGKSLASRYEGIQSGTDYEVSNKKAWSDNRSTRNWSSRLFVRSKHQSYQAGDPTNAIHDNARTLAGTNQALYWTVKVSSSAACSRLNDRRYRKGYLLEAGMNMISELGNTRSTHIRERSHLGWYYILWETEGDNKIRIIEADGGVK